MKSINGQIFKSMVICGANALHNYYPEIDALNVFPVPDGDTGTNMTMTIMSAAREVAAIEEPTMENLARAISSGSLRGARGNSGVILSQLFRGADLPDCGHYGCGGQGGGAPGGLCPLLRRKPGGAQV